MLNRADRLRRFAAIAVLLTCPLAVWAFQEEGKPAKTGPAGAKEAEVQIHREALPLTSPTVYKVHLALAPIRTLELTAPVDGYVRTVNCKLGGKISKESEAIRLEDARAVLLVKGAKARLTGAMIEKGMVQGKGDALKLAEARVEEAQAALELAQLDMTRLIIRAPYAGEVHELHVVEGQFVRAGEPVATIADVSALHVEVPVDRSVKVGSEIDLKIDDAAVKGKVEVTLPLSKPFEPLRDLSDTLQTATVVLDNPSGKYIVGQSVYCELIPLSPVTSVPTVAVKNQKDGNRKIQVLRRQVVRDIPVRIHSKVGVERVFVSGPLQEGDELITSSSMELADGTPVRALLAAASDATAAGQPAGQTKPKKPAAAAAEGF